mgnify:CR=1 FL=1
MTTLEGKLSDFIFGSILFISYLLYPNTCKACITSSNSSCLFSSFSNSDFNFSSSILSLFKDSNICNLSRKLLIGSEIYMNQFNI